MALNQLLGDKPVRLSGSAGNVRGYVHPHDVRAMAMEPSTSRRPFDGVTGGSGRLYLSVPAVTRDFDGSTLPIRLKTVVSGAKDERGSPPVRRLPFRITGMLTPGNGEGCAETALSQ